LKDAIDKTGLKDAGTNWCWKIKRKRLSGMLYGFCFYWRFYGSCRGEKIARGIDYSIQHNIPFVMISKSGGARMMEAAYPLMQLAKTSAKLAQLAEAKIPYISLCTDPYNRGNNSFLRHVGRH